MKKIAILSLLFGSLLSFNAFAEDETCGGADYDNDVGEPRW